jgi:hypothetical protein
MANKNKHILFHPSGCLTQEAVKAYLSGHLDERGNEQVASHLTHCGLCSTALKGIKRFDNLSDLEASAHQVNRKLEQRLLKRDNPPLRTMANRWLLAAAAVALATVGAFYLLNWRETGQPTTNNRLLGENVILNDTLLFYGIKPSQNKYTGPIDDQMEHPKTPAKKKEAQQVKTGKNKAKKASTELPKSFIVKNDMIIRESDIPELLEPMQLPFQQYVKNKMDSLLMASVPGKKFEISSAFTLTGDGKVEQPREGGMGHSGLDSFTLSVLQGAPSWKNNGKNQIPDDYPIKILIRNY